ncbi:MFS transporter [Mucilaginibacter ginsenosidivorans]|uniref:MFS transporter n=1 Tax=Mucilaginibacter ginsenosidivorans TaxID=398053 RepID=UPI001E5B3D32|nr:MFS transporter [Mucilaginibacter ginsenosidivorans]
MDTASAPAISPRKIRIANAFFFFVSGFGYTTWTSRIIYIQQSLHLNERLLGTALLALPAGLMLTMPITGRMLSTISSSRIMLIGALAFNLMLGLLGFTSQYWQFIVILFFFGSSRNILNLSINTQSVSVQKLYKKSIITTFHGIWSFAGLAGSVLGLIMAYFKVPPTWHLLVVSIGLCIVALIAWPNTLHQKPEPPEKKPIFSLPDKALLKFALICFSSMACENVMYDWSGVYFYKAVHASKVTATAGFVIFMIAVTIGRFSGDSLVNKWGIKHVIQNSAILIVAGFAVVVGLTYNIPVLLGYALIGFGVSCMVPLVLSAAGRSKSMSGGPAIAAVSTVGYLGFLLVPPVVGFIAQAANLRWAFATISLLGLVILWMTTKMHDDE